MDVRGVLTALTLEQEQAAIPSVAENVHRFRWWIFAYLMLTSGAGVAAGFATGRLVVNGKLRGLTQHGWVYDLTVADNLTVAYVVTHIREGDRVLMYQGFLRGFALQRDGRFSYVVLTDVLRGYLRLGERPVTRSHDELRPIGASGLAMRSHAGQKARYSRRERSYFVIEGEDIANAVFDRLEFDLKAASPAEFHKIVERERARLESEGVAADTGEPGRST